MIRHVFHASTYEEATELLLRWAIEGVDCKVGGESLQLSTINIIPISIITDLPLPYTTSPNQEEEVTDKQTHHGLIRSKTSSKQGLRNNKLGLLLRSLKLLPGAGCWEKGTSRKSLPP